MKNGPCLVDFGVQMPFLGQLAEDQSAVMDKVKEKARTMDQANLRNIANRFGKVRTRKFFNVALTN
jgi:hypothetical protein